MLISNKYCTFPLYKNKETKREKNKKRKIINKNQIQGKHTYLTNKQSRKQTNKQTKQNKFNKNINISQTNKKLTNKKQKNKFNKNTNIPQANKQTNKTNKKQE